MICSLSFLSFNWFLDNKVRYLKHAFTDLVFFSYSNNLNRRFSRVAHREQPTLSRQYWPFPSTSNTFYWPSAFRDLHELHHPDSRQLNEHAIATLGDSG